MSKEKRCTQCRLSDTCSNILQMGKGKRTARIMVVQESPYERESIRNEYMGGKAGKVFRSALSEVGIDIDDVYYTAVVKCTTPEDRLPTPDEVKACSDYLLAEIDVINPEIIIPTGNMSLKALLGGSAITKSRGRLVQKDGRKYFPMIHPNMVLKFPKYLETFSKDMVNLESILNGSTPADVLDYEKERLYCETYESAIEELDRLANLPAGTAIVLDIETTKDNAFLDKVLMSDRMKAMYPDSETNKISAIGFSDRPGYGCAIPLYHRETPFSGNQIGGIVKVIRQLLSRDDLVFAAHNGKFDLKWLRRQLQIYVENFLWDTMLMHYAGVTEERGTHDLKQLAWMETTMGGYDDALDDVKPKGELDEGNYDIIPWDILKIYLADDCDCNQRLLVKYIPLIERDEELKWLWDNLILRAHNTLLNIESDGIKVDSEWLDKLCLEYPKELERLKERLHQFPEVLDIERGWEQLWIERLTIGQIQKRDRTEEQGFKFDKYKKYDPSKGGCEFNFGSHAQLKLLLFDTLGLTTPILTDKGEEHVRMGGKPTSEHYSTKDESLELMASQHPIANLLQEFRKVNHLNNNFVTGLRALLDPEGFVHPNYNIHGTVTGRLSGNAPNPQQFPRMVPLTSVDNVILFQYWNEIKDLFISRFGDNGVIIQFDYSQLELRILAVFSQDEALIALYRSGADLHRAVAADAFGVTIDEVTKDQRTAAKKIQFGIVYQESAKGLSEDLRAEGIEMSVQECQKFIDRYFSRFPKVRKWIEQIKRFAHKNKYVKTLTNRIRHLMAIDSSDRSISAEAERQAVNAPIQSTGSDCTLMSLILIDEWLRKNKMLSRVFITVHDSIGIDTHKSEVFVVARKVKHIMENLAEYVDFYKFLGDVPIISEMEIGYAYGTAFECSIDVLEEQGIDEFLTAQLAKKKEKEDKFFKEAEEKRIKIPDYVRGYWSKSA